MKRKVQKVYEDHGFGFRVTLLNVPMIEVRGEWVPDVNQKRLQTSVLDALCVKPARLTGHEVRFIRHCFEMTLEEFGRRFYVTHPAVKKWEGKGSHPTGMMWATEKDIRLYILSKHSAHKNNFKAFVEAYLNLEHEQSGEKHPLKVDVEKLSA